MKITKGIWKRTFVGPVESPNSLAVVRELPDGGRQHICSVDYDNDYKKEFTEMLEANFDLIAEAGTVKNETGFSPRQLAERNDIYLKSLKEILRLIDNSAGISQFDGFKEVIHAKKLIKPTKI